MRMGAWPAMAPETVRFVGQSCRRWWLPKTKNQARDAAEAVAIDYEELPQDRNARFDPRPDADPLLPRARASRGPARPARPAASPSRTPSSIPRPTASPRPIWTGRSSSTTCSAARPPPCARSWRSCAPPIAARSVSNSCTSRIRTRNPGSSAASRARPGWGRSMSRRKRKILPPAHRGRRLRGVLPEALRRHQAFRARGRRGRPSRRCTR